MAPPLAKASPLGQRRKATTDERVGLLSCWGLVPRPFGIDREPGSRGGRERISRSGTEQEMFAPGASTENFRLACCVDVISSPTNKTPRLHGSLFSLSHGETKVSYGTFCDLGCSLAAKDVLNREGRVGQEVNEIVHAARRRRSAADRALGPQSASPERLAWRPDPSALASGSSRAARACC